MTRHLLSTLDRGRFERLWNSGMPCVEIARKFGRKGSGWASTTAARMGLPARGPRGDLDAPTVLAMLEDGLTAEQIAEEMHVDSQRVRNCLDSMAMSPKHPEYDPDA